MKLMEGNERIDKPTLIIPRYIRDLEADEKK